MNEDKGTGKLDKVDGEIIKLVAKHFEVQRQLMELTGKVESPAQTSKRIDALMESCSVAVLPTECKLILAHIASACRAQLASGQIAFLGPEHSYSHLAAIKYFGEGSAFAPEATIAAVFDSVVRHQASTGIVPIENSTDGRVVDTLGMFVSNPVNICGEVLLPIHHYLLSNTPRAEIRKIYSKPQAISQCRGWLAEHAPSAQLHEMSSTAAAAELASREKGVAAVASEAAGRQYDLDIIAANIEDNPNNVTRFAVLGEGDVESSGYDKTALLLQVNHAPGALADVMNVFKNRKLNLTFIESFPMPQAPSEYLFFVELEGHKTDEPVVNALADLNAFTIRCDILGSFPRDRSLDKS